MSEPWLGRPISRDHLTKAETITVAAIESGVPELVKARNLIDPFQTMIRVKAAAEIDARIPAAHDSLIVSSPLGSRRTSEAGSRVSQV